MNPTVPLFLPRRVSDYSQLNRGGPCGPGVGRGPGPRRPHGPTPEAVRRTRPAHRAGGRGGRRGGHGPPRRRRPPGEVPCRLGRGRHRSGAVHGLARQPGRVDGAAGHPGAPARRAVRTRVDGQRLHAHLRRAPAVGRRAGRAVRTPSDLRGRHRPLHGVVGRRRPRAGDHGPDRRPGAPGSRRRHDHAAVADPAQCRRPARAPQRRPRDLGSHRRVRRGHRTTGRRRRHQRVGLAVHLLAQRAGRTRPPPPGPLEAVRVPWIRRAARPGRGRAGECRPLRGGPRTGAGERPRVDLGVGDGLLHRRRAAAGRLRGA